MLGREMTCKELVELVTAYLDDSLSIRRRRRFEQHLAGCDGCTRYVAQMAATVRATGSLTEEQVTEEQRAVLLATFRDWRAG